MSYSMSGLGQAKTGAAAPDHTAQDWATAGQFAQVGGSIVGGIIGATQGQTPQMQAQQQAQQQALLAQQQAAAAPAGGGVDWYWPVVIGGGLLLVGGIAWMMMSAPKKKAAPAAAPTANRRFKRNKHKRRKARGSRKPKKNYAYEHISHPYSYGPGGRPRRNQARYVPSHTLIVRNRKLSASKRGKLPKSKFVFPGRRTWPIESAAAAYDAIRDLHLGRVKSASDYMAITSFIQRHYPATWKKYHHMLSWPKSKAAKALGMKRRAATRAHKKRGSKKAAA